MITYPEKQGVIVGSSTVESVYYNLLLYAHYVTFLSNRAVFLLLSKSLRVREETHARSLLCESEVAAAAE